MKAEGLSKKQTKGDGKMVRIFEGVRIRKKYDEETKQYWFRLFKNGTTFALSGDQLPAELASGKEFEGYIEAQVKGRASDGCLFVIFSVWIGNYKLGTVTYRVDEYVTCDCDSNVIEEALTAYRFVRKLLGWALVKVEKAKKGGEQK
jgi:hypothetical protein